MADKIRKIMLHALVCLALLWTSMLPSRGDDTTIIPWMASAAAATSVKMTPVMNQKRRERRLASTKAVDPLHSTSRAWLPLFHRSTMLSNGEPPVLLLVSRTRLSSDHSSTRTRRRRRTPSSSSKPSTSSSRQGGSSLTFQDRPSSCSNALLAQRSKLKQKQQQRQQPTETPSDSPSGIDSTKESSTTTTIENTGPTLIAGIAQHFQGIFCKGGRDLNTVKLLKACRYLEKSMRQVGQRANANELLSNIHKVESVYKIAPKNQRETVSDLLLYERDTLQIHQPHGLLHDPSAAIGLLWLRRSLEFQTKLYQYAILADAAPTVDATAAALHAYHETLEHHHGWKIQRVYSLALRTSTPNRADMCVSLSGYYSKNRSSTRSRTPSTGSSRERHHRSTTATRATGTTSRSTGPMAILTPRQEEILQNDMKQLLSQWKPLVARWKQIFILLDMEDMRKV